MMVPSTVDFLNKKRPRMYLRLRACPSMERNFKKEKIFFCRCFWVGSSQRWPMGGPLYLSLVVPFRAWLQNGKAFAAAYVATVQAFLVLCSPDFFGRIIMR
jgi:hypothetical protein